MPFKIITFLIFFFPLFLSAQNSERDILKIGYTQVFLGQQNSSSPGLFIEYNRTFYPPITIGVSGGLASFNGLMDTRDTYDLFTFNLDLNFLYGILENDRNQFQLGLGISARSFRIEGIERATSILINNNSLRPGISVIINYHYIFDPLIAGFRGVLQNYSEEGAVYFFGGFLGLRF